MQSKQEHSTTWLDKSILSSITLNWETIIFVTIIVLAFVTRFYDLESRVMSHDENSHVYYSWQLSQGGGYSHTPMTHGPYQFHIVALSYFLFGDNDFTARIPAALFGIAMIAFLWYYRRYLGRVGTLVAAGLMLISPFLLFYARYVRNDIFSALFGVIMVWAILRYLETGESKYTYWLTAVAVLHYTTKETSFIYTAQALLFLGLLFVYQVTQKRWEIPKYRNIFLAVLILSFVCLAIGFGLNNFIETPTPTAEETTQATPLYLLISFGLGGLAMLSALVIAIIGFTWDRLRENRAFSLILLQLTLVLPQLAPFPVSALGWDALDYTTTGMLRTGIFIGILAAMAIAVGMLWNSRLWLINAAIFYIPFTIFYTTVFTNGAGFFTGMVGSLGYWLMQQAVERGSQPWYYYILIQVPVYEFLPLLGSILAGYYWIRLKGETALEGQEQPDPQVDSPLEEEIPPKAAPIIPLLSFWSFSSIIAYTVAGEKMPWLTVHIAWPMILLASWGLGKLIERIDWDGVKTKRGLLLITLIVVFLVSLTSAIGMIAGPNPPFQGKELHQLNTTNAFVLAVLMTIICVFALSKVIAEWEFVQIGRLTTLTIFTFLALITARAAFRAAYINYDYPTEYLVYAHSGSGPKIAMNQIEELSMRTTDGKDMVVAYDDETTYPYWWYLRNYPNQKYYGPNPTRELRDAPVILVGDNNFDKIEPVVGQAYHKFEYIRIWWPNQDYYNLTWERINNALFDPQMRGAIFQIWLNRDYTQYAVLKGTDLSLPNWSPSDRMRLYVRKDIAAQVWNFGSVPVDVDEILADPYEGKEITLLADKTLGTNGTEPGNFEKPRDIALAPDGSLFVADTGNHRIQHFTAEGEVLNTWGYFADSSQTDAPGGSFYEPWGIAVDSLGDVYVTDTWNHRVQKFTPNGEFITQWGYFGQAETGAAFWGPRDILVDDLDRVFITDTGNKRVVVFSNDGVFLTAFGSAGLLEGQFDEPVGLAVDANGRIYVADTWNKRVQVFEADVGGLAFEPVLEWEIVGWYGQSLDNKPFIAVDDFGRVFVSDPESYRILEFNTEGEFIRYWGDYGAGPEGFSLPGGMATSPEGELWIADAGNHRILHFSLPDEIPSIEE
ncbi:MAG: TIGR03663 family protein [Anaerolineales bacterium]|nr:TIGR03663 family protein [Chloroflexota bacterium]MBL6980188.1 TIGR03663 family protein [Anaerolineales bacterium]